GLVREVTRVRKKGESERLDRAEVRTGNRVPDIRGRHQVACPLLRTDGRYVSFNGNGLRRGLGYLIVGKKRGWLARCRYLVGVDARGKSAGPNRIGRLRRAL